MKTLATLVALLGLAASTLARDLTFAWDPAPEPDLAEIIFYLEFPFQSGTYVEFARIPAMDGNGLKVAQATLTDLPDEKFRVYATCTNTADLESLPSNILTVPKNPSPPGRLRLKKSR